MSRHYEDFTGQIINGMKVIKVDPNSGGAGKHKKWICECPLCLNYFSVQSNHLKEKKTGLCPECIKIQREDLTGKRFHHLIVNSMIYPGPYKRTLCSCTCDCGATNIIIQANHLKNDEIKSCGCLKSSGEENISKILTNNSVNFERQKTFPGLKYKNPLYCDFFLPDFNLVIEYNGEQHYKPVNFYGGEDNLKIIQLRDQIKKNYCIEHNINFLVIRFDENIEEALIKNNIIMKRQSARCESKRN